MNVDPTAECQANRRNAAAECKRCGRKSGQGCGEDGPAADPAITRALEEYDRVCREYPRTMKILAREEDDR